MNIVWKEEQKRNAIVALFFLIYPAFLLQPMSVMFALHWAMYLVYMLSIWAMLKALDNPRYFSILMVISLLLEIAHLLMLEYFVGLEFLRPFLIFAIFKNKSLRERLISTLKTSFPFLLILGIYIAFRLSFAETFSYDRNTPVILYQLFEEPLKTIVYLFQTMLQDFSEILITAWYGTIEPALFSFSRISNLIVWGNVLVFTIFFVLYFSKLREPENKKKKPDDWAKGMILLGLISVLLGVLPGWAVGKTVHTSNPLWNDRFTMASLFGAGMVWVGLIYKFFRKESHIILILGIMISLAIGTNMRTAFQYKASWEKQSRFYWELFWRAPEIESKTALLADSEFLFFMGVYPTSFAINTLYQSNDNLADMNYWLYVSNERLGKWEDFRAGNTLEYQKYASDFRGSSLNSFAILFEPEKLQCLWVLRPEDKDNRLLTPLMHEFLPTSNISRIKANDDALPLEAIFGKEPAHNRCYFYEKADLARQQEDWQEVTKLWDAAEKKNELPNHGVEYIPFIEAFAHESDWLKAKKLTFRANLISERMGPYLCQVWQNMDKENAPETVLQDVQDKLKCEAFLP